MFKHIPFFRISIPYILGISIGKLNVSVDLRLILLLIVISILIIFLLSVKKSGFFLLSGFLCIFLFLTGFYTYLDFNKRPGNVSGDAYIATIQEYPVEKTNSIKMESRLKFVLDSDKLIKFNEKLILYFEPDLSIVNLEPGDQIIFTSHPGPIKNMGNPYEFDYKGYMANKKIYKQVYLRQGSWKVQNKDVFSPVIIAQKLRHKVLNIYRQLDIEGEQFAILSALTLGYKDALDPETKQVYSSTGAMHVLAVSGLHVGIIFLAANTLLGFLKKSKNGRFMFIISVILLLWLYALLTGLSPSVLRATVMLSVIIIGDNLRRPTNTYNSLAVSAFILLCINPNLLFETGFQLSYTAVTGIVFFQPKINRLLTFKNNFLRYAWGLFTVSIAAQLSTFPLTIYYFHQFPTYFWISNFIVIPTAFIMIFLAIGIILTSPIPIIAKVLTYVIAFFLDSTYYLLSEIQKLPHSIIQNIHIDKIQLILLFISIASLMIFLIRKKAVYLLMIASILIGFYSINIFHKYKCIKQTKLIVYNAGQEFLLHLIFCNKNYVIFEHERQLKNYDFTSIGNTVTANHLKKPAYLCSDSIYCDESIFIKKPIIAFKDKCIYIPEKEYQNLPDLKTCALLLKQNSIPSEFLSLKNIITSSKFTNTKNQSHIHSLNNDGAFILNF